VILPDANLIIYAHDKDNPNYRAASTWWEAVLNGERPVGLAFITILAFMRVVTSRKALANPASVPAAIAIVREWLTRKNVTIVQPGSGHCELLLDLIERVGVAGNLTSDAHLAALAIEWQAEVATSDVDFSRFPGVRWYNPLKR
jgi:toxin-antitoxin system PIN domain toxin